MAKLGFKDIIMKYLKKDEAFKLTYVDPLNKKNFHISYRSKGEAEAKMAQLKRDGVKDVQITQEDAPATATGTAVAGTGDDSSTVVVKKKKELQKNLMRIMGIKEAIDRAIPDLEYPKDEIRERVNQLKDMASKSEDLGKEDEPLLKRMANKLKKSSDLHGKQAKDIEKAIKNEDLDAQPQDKDVKKIKGTQPKKYYKKMSPPEKEKRAKFFRKQKYKKSDDDDDYKAAPGDDKAKTKKSIHTKKYDKMYGKDEAMYAYGYPAMTMKPVAKLNPLKRKDESK